MRDLIIEIVQAIVDRPEEVSVNEIAWARLECRGLDSVSLVTSLLMNHRVERCPLGERVKFCSHEDLLTYFLRPCLPPVETRVGGGHAD